MRYGRPKLGAGRLGGTRRHALDALWMCFGFDIQALDTFWISFGFVLDLPWIGFGLYWICTGFATQALDWLWIVLDLYWICHPGFGFVLDLPSRPWIHFGFALDCIGFDIQALDTLWICHLDLGFALD